MQARPNGSDVDNGFFKPSGQAFDHDFIVIAKGFEVLKQFAFLHRQVVNRFGCGEDWQRQKEARTRGPEKYCWEDASEILI